MNIMMCRYEFSEFVLDDLEDKHTHFATGSRSRAAYSNEHQGLEEYHYRLSSTRM
jgi:hypothetical protein